MYMGLGFVAYYEYSRDEVFRNKYRNRLLKLFLFFVFFGGMIEILQGTVFKPRSCEFADWIADIIGLALGMGAGRLLKKYFVKKRG